MPQAPTQDLQWGREDKQYSEGYKKRKEKKNDIGGARPPVAANERLNTAGNWQSTVLFPEEWPCSFLPSSLFPHPFLTLAVSKIWNTIMWTMESPGTLAPVAGVVQSTSDLRYIRYEHGLEKQYLPAIRALISKDLSEPYSIYVYRYFLYQWSHLCFMVLFILAADLLVACRYSYLLPHLL